MNAFGKRPGLRLVVLRLAAIIITTVTAMAFILASIVLVFGRLWLFHFPAHSPQSAIWAYRGSEMLGLILSTYIMVRHIVQQRQRQRQLDMFWISPESPDWYPACVLLYGLSMVVVVASIVRLANWLL